VEKHGGEPVCIPALEEQQDLDIPRAEKLIGALTAKDYDLVIFMTGVAVSLLFEAAEQVGRRAELVAGLRHVSTLCRGPKPTAALRGFGVTPTITARESFTSAEVIDAMTGIEVKGSRVLLFHYGERGESIAETLVAREAIVEEHRIYRWRLPGDTSALQGLVADIVGGKLDALAVTCQIQFRHLYQVAQRLGLEQDLVRTLNQRMAVGAVGPTCRAVLELYGVDVDVIPDHPKMGPLIVSLMRHLEHRAPLARGERAAP
jgi:uroporphyrinogen-III synthase